jgi:putative transcriptional regulator
MSQVKMASHLKINASSIVQVEKGYRKPWPKLRKQIAELLLYDEKNLFTEDGWPRKINNNHINQ